MNYDVSALFAVSACRVVFVQDSDAANGIEKAVIACKPEYKTEINQAFLPKKLGPFTLKNRKPLWKILMQTEDAEEGGAAYLHKVTPGMALDRYEDRIPSVLAPYQIERASVMYDAMNHRFHFLINDIDTFLDAEPDPNGYTIAMWLKDYIGYKWASCELIWISYMKEKELMEKLGESEMKDPYYSFFTVKDGCVVARDKDTLQKLYFPTKAAEPAHTPKRRRTAVDYAYTNLETQAAPSPQAPSMTPEELFQKGRQYDGFSGIGTSMGGGDAKEAFRWYKAAAEEGHMRAQNCLGILYQCGLGGCEVDLRKAMFWYSEAVKNPDYHESTADADTRKTYQAAQKNLKDLIVKAPNAKNLLRQFLPNKAEEIIRKAELERGMAASITDADREYFRETMNRILREKF